MVQFVCYIMNWEQMTSKIDTYIQNTPDACILDIGCGDSEWLINYYKKFKPKKLVGIDNDDSLKETIFGSFILYVHQQNPIGDDSFLRTIYPNLAKEFDKTFQYYYGDEGDLLNFKIPTEEYDLIIAKNILHFLPPSEQVKCLDKIYKGIKKGGAIFIMVNGYKSFLEKKLNGNLDHCKIEENRIGDEFIELTVTSIETGKQIKKYLPTEKGIKKLYITNISNDYVRLVDDKEIGLLFINNQ